MIWIITISRLCVHFSLTSQIVSLRRMIVWLLFSWLVTPWLVNIHSSTNTDLNVLWLLFIYNSPMCFLAEDGESDEQVVLVSQSGTVNRIKVRDISIQSRRARYMSTPFI